MPNTVEADYAGEATQTQENRAKLSRMGHLDKEPLHGIYNPVSAERRQQQRIVTRQDDIAKLLTTRLHGLPG